MKIAVIGAGISGLSIARLLGERHDVEVLERNSTIGGIARVKMINDIPYHTVGGHCFNSKNKAVMDFVHGVLPLPEWHQIKRNAKILLRGRFIDYPIEYSIQQIFEFDEELALSMALDLMAAPENVKAENYGDWLDLTFGKTLASEYFIPYNTKIWGLKPSEMSTSWINGKLPVPNKKMFLRSLMGRVEDAMPHVTFYYPNENTQNKFIDALGEGSITTTNYSVERLEKAGTGWLINGEKKVDLVVSTLPLNVIPFLIEGAPSEVRTAAGLLRYNRITNMLWETEETEATWTYFPNLSSVFHRHIHIGNFILPRRNYAITEAVGVLSPETMASEGRKISYLKTPVDHHVSDHAYVVFDRYRASSVNTIFRYLDELGIHTLGRFGEWNYYNMDICIERAMELAKLICSSDH